MKGYFVVLIAFVALLAVPSALGYVITGTILNENNEAVKGANVAIHFYSTHGLIRETTSDGSGVFRIEIPSRENTYYVRVEHPDYQVFEQPYFFTMYEEFREIKLRVYLQAPLEPEPPAIEHVVGRMRMFADAFPTPIANPLIGLLIVSVLAVAGLALRRREKA